MFQIVLGSYVFIGLFIYALIRSRKPLRYQREAKKVQNDVFSMWGYALSPRMAHIVYTVGLVMVFPMSLNEYFFKKEKKEPVRFDHKRPKGTVSRKDIKKVVAKSPPKRKSNAKNKR